MEYEIKPKRVIIAAQPRVFPPEWLAVVKEWKNNRPTYAHSVIHKCDKCGQDVYLGPRQQDLLANMAVANTTVEVMCWVCCRDVEGSLVHLGNPGHDEN